MAKVDGQWVPGRGETIGLWEDGLGPIAAVMFESCNGASVMAHIAGEGKKWMNREFLWYIFHYPFKELGVNKILAPVESTNAKVRKLNEHFGFILEATLIGAAPKGDLLIYSMTQDQCKWLNLRDKYRGETKGS